MTIYRVSTISVIVSRGISFQQGGATISNKLLSTKISTESLAFLFLKLISLKGFSVNTMTNRCPLFTAFQFWFGYVLRKFTPYFFNDPIAQFRPITATKL